MAEKSDSFVQAANEYFDALVKSRFIEMFGDWNNDSEYPEMTMSEVCANIVDCPHSTPKYSDSVTIYPTIRTTDIVSGQIVWNQMKYVDEIQYNDRIKRLRPQENDIVLGREGTIGEVALLPPGYAFCLGQRVMLLRANQTVVNPMFLCHVFQSNYVQTIFKSKNTGSTVNHVNVKDVVQLKVYVPPMEAQNQFADFVKQVDKSKLLFQQLVSKYDQLVKSRFNEILNDELLTITELKNLITQDQTTEKIDNPEKEIFVTLQSRGKGAKQREITEGKTPVKFTGYRIKAGQFIYSRIDARNGAFDIVPTSLDGAVVSKDFPVFEIDSEKVNPVFLLSSVLQPSFIQQIQSNSFGATNRQRIKEDVLLKYMIKMPSMEIQNQFADFVRQVDKSKSEILEGIKRLNLPQIN